MYSEDRRLRAKRSPADETSLDLRHRGCRGGGGLRQFRRVERQLDQHAGGCDEHVNDRQEEEAGPAGEEEGSPQEKGQAEAQADHDRCERADHDIFSGGDHDALSAAPDDHVVRAHVDGSGGADHDRLGSGADHHAFIAARHDDTLVADDNSLQAAVDPDDDRSDQHRSSR